MRTPSFWQHRGLLSTLLWPLSLLYWLGFRLHRAITTPARAPLPVIGVGNVTAGGAGKTPTTIALVALLRELGETPHIITRGYGGTAQRAHYVDSLVDTAETVGDEALLLAAHAPTWVGRNRLASAHAAHAAGASVVIADDAMQHHALIKDITLLVVDALYGFGNGRLLPAGPLREPIDHALARTDRTILIGDPAVTARRTSLSERTPLIAAQLAPSGDCSFLRHGRWLAFAGIAHPDKFFATLRQHGAELGDTASFPDHHPFSAKEILDLLARARGHQWRLITTEKDHVRLPPELRASVMVLPVTLYFTEPKTMATALRQMLQAARRPSVGS